MERENLCDGIKDGKEENGGYLMLGPVATARELGRCRKRDDFNPARSMARTDGGSKKLFSKKKSACQGEGTGIFTNFERAVNQNTIPHTYRRM